MIGKKILDEKPVTLAEAKEIISNEKKEREDALNYEQKITYTYVNKFAAAPTKTQKAKDALLELGLNDEEAIQLINVHPQIPEQVQAVLDKRKVDKDTTSKILEALEKL